jgi:transglutaminase-like putative cysteine protease
MRFVDRRFFIKTCLTGVSSGLAAPHALSRPAIASPLPGAEILQRKIRFSLQFHNPSETPLERQTFWCYLPFNSPQQQLREVKVSMPHRLHGDALGHQILELAFDAAHGFFRKIVTLETLVEHTPNPGKDRKTLSDPSPWLLPEKFVESGHPEIQKQAIILRQETDMKTIRAIYDWVSGNMAYSGYITEDRGALYALTHRQGDCTEYAHLVVALSRANNIPARMIGGYVTAHDIVPKPQDYHNWAEVFLEGVWRIVDAQKQRFFPENMEYTGFRIHHEDNINIIGNQHRYRMDGELRVGF